MASPAAITEANANAESDFDTADPAQVNRARKKASRAERQRHDVVGGLMSLPEGRAWLYGLLEICHIWASSFTENVQHMAFREGERNVGLRILSEIMASAPDQYPVMVKEAKV